MTTQQPLSADDRVFDWLFAATAETSYHLRLLNLMWSDAGAEHDLAIFRGIAERLNADTAYWSNLIRDVNWRCSLIGCVCLLTVQRQDFFDDLCFRFEMGSMIAPQLAVTIGLLHPAEAVVFFEKILATPSLLTNPTRRVSAERVLVYLGTRQSSELTLQDWSIHEKDHALLADQVIQQHWDFWQPHVQHLSKV